MKEPEIVCLCQRTLRGLQYLGGFESTMYGRTYIPYFSYAPSCAIPLSPATADFILSRLEYDCRKYLYIMPYPKIDLVSMEDIFPT